MGRGRNAAVVRAATLFAGLALLLGSNLAFAAGKQLYIDVRLIAVSTRNSGLAEIWSFNLDGTGGRALTTGPAAHYSPKVSPDGKRIAFTGEDGGAYSIYVMNVDGSGVVRLTRRPMSAGTPTWSPDGTLIAFAGSVAGAAGYQIWTMKPDGTGQKQLTHLPNSSNGSPAFSPDGTTIAFASSTTSVGGIPTSRIYTMHADGSGAMPVTNGPVDGYPAWTDATSFLLARAGLDGKTSQVFLKMVGGGDTPESPAGAFYTEPQPSADGSTYIATGQANGAGLGLFRVPLNGGTGPSGGTPITIAGGGDTYSPVLIEEQAPAVPSAPPSAGPVAASVPAGPGAAQPSGVVSIAVPAGSAGGRPSLNIWEILIGVGIVAVVIGGITYWVKLRPKKDGCDPQRAAVLAAEAEFTAAQAAFDAAEAVHDKAVAVRHNADAQVNWVSDQPAGPKVEQAEAAQAAAVSAEADAYQALVKAGTRQGAARINLDVARKRLADCLALNAFIEDAWESLPPAPEPPEPLSPDVIRQIQDPGSAFRDMPITDPKTGKPYPSSPPPDEDDDQPAPDSAPSAGNSERVDPDHIPIYEGPGFDPVPPSPPPEVKPPVDNREIG